MAGIWLGFSPLCRVGLKGCLLPLPSMGLALEDLLSAIGAELDRANPPLTPPGALRWVGRLILSPRILDDVGIRDGHHVWTSGPGWVVLDSLDIERWCVDAPSGNHLIVCERDEMNCSSVPEISGVSVTLWSPGDYTSMIGKAVLQGDIPISSTESPPVVESKPAEQDLPSATLPTTPMPPSGIDLAVAPRVDVAQLMEERGRHGLALHPVMLDTTLWVVEGELVGPDGIRANNRWWIIEDSFTGECRAVEPFDTLHKVPNLEVISPPSHLDEAGMRHRLSALLDERRAEELSDTESEQTAMGGLLRWWRLDTEKSHLTRYRLLLPAWLGRMPLDGMRIVHGWSGEELPLPQK